jgi:CelD/BcsL family acetyltransferase involved in cellulose biosynthesis
LHEGKTHRDLRDGGCSPSSLTASIRLGKTTMLVRRHDTLAEIATLAADWNRLADGHPFRTWEWLGSWWETYGEGKLESFVVSVTDDSGRIVLLAPWWMETSLARGRLVRFWGDNEVCTDHLTLLAEPGAAPAAIAALADWLVAAVADGSTSPGGLSNQWDTLELKGILADDPTIGLFIEQLTARGIVPQQLAGPASWRIDFSDDFEEYLKRLSSDRRREARRAYDRWILKGEAKLNVACTPEELNAAWPIFADLHQKRRKSLGEPGCLASEPFGQFLRKALDRLAALGMLRLNVLEMEGRPAAACLALTSGDTGYVYQMGMEPALASLAPGKILSNAVLRLAFDQGIRHWDFLRGEEMYKTRLRALPIPQITLLAVAPATLAQLRGSVWSAGQQMKDWIKSGLSFAGLR